MGTVEGFRSSSEPLPGSVHRVGSQETHEVDQPVTRRMKYGGVGPTPVVDEGVGELEGPPADHTEALLSREPILDALEVQRVAPRREPAAGLVEGHPLAVLGGLAPAGGKRRESVVSGRSDVVPIAVGRETLAELLGRDAGAAAGTCGGGAGARGRGLGVGHRPQDTNLREYCQVIGNLHNIR
jgi:hypothetical protein